MKSLFTRFSPMLLALAFFSTRASAFIIPFSFWNPHLASGSMWYSGITYTTSSWNYGSCVAPSEATMNDESTSWKTTWAAASNSSEWIMADLGSSKPVDGVRVGGAGAGLCGYTAAGQWSNAIVEVSNDASSWTTVGSNVSYFNTDMTNVSFTSTTVRYVRLSRPNWFGTGQFRVGTGVPPPPPNPSGSSATVDSNTQVTLSWTSGGGSTALFAIAYVTGASAPVSCAAGTFLTTGTSPKAITGLVAGTQYSFRICAADGSGGVSSGITAGATTTGQCPAGQYRSGGICVNAGYGYYSPADDDNRYACTLPPNTVNDGNAASSENFSFLVPGGCYTCSSTYRYDSGSGTCVADPCAVRNGPVPFNGYNWYIGADGESCDTLCAAYGKTTDLAGTRNYIGSGGSFANCIAVYNAMGCPARETGFDGPDDGAGSTIGCFTYHAYTTQHVLRRYTGTTVGSSAWLNRICACTP